MDDKLFDEQIPVIAFILHDSLGPPRAGGRIERARSLFPLSGREIVATVISFTLLFNATQCELLVLGDF